MAFNAQKDMLKHNHRTLFGLDVEQSWASLFVLEKMLAAYRPDIVSELGTGDGTLSVYFQQYCMLHKAEFYTRDINLPAAGAFLAGHFTRCDFHQPDVITQVTMELNSCQRPFLLIDGADPKSDEVNMYAPYLRAGTLVFSHDYRTRPANNAFRWGYDDTKIDWTRVEKAEPWNTMALQLDTRMLCLRAR